MRKDTLKRQSIKASQPGSDMTQRLGLSNKGFKITMANMLEGLTKRQTTEKIGNVRRHGDS